jgi:hypothetical protein
MKEGPEPMSQPGKKPTIPYIVSVVQDLSECAEVQVDATSSSEAEEVVSALLRQGRLDKLDYARGDDQGNPYTCGCWEKDDDTLIDCIITNNEITFAEKPTRKISGPLTACPQCGAELNASIRLTLYTVTLNEHGLVSAYEGGPEPESTSEIIELCQADNTTIICTNNHHISGPPA